MSLERKLLDQDQESGEKREDEQPGKPYLAQAVLHGESSIFCD